MKKLLFLLTISGFLLTGCSQAAEKVSKSFEDNIYYYTYFKKEYDRETKKDIYKYEVVVFDKNAKDKAYSLDLSTIHGAQLVCLEDDFLNYYDPSVNSTNNTYTTRLGKQTHVYCFGNELVPEFKNDGNGIGKDEWTINIDDSKVVITSKASTDNLYSTLYVTESYAKANNYTIIYL